MTNYQRYLADAGYYVGAGVGGFVHLWQGAGQTLPEALTKVLQLGVELGGFKITVQAVAGALALYLVYLKLSKK
jgi:hypothetical protein